MMGELATCVKYKLPLRIVVIKNDSLAQIKWEQMVFLGNPEYVCDLQPFDFAAVARAFGMASFVIQDPRRCGSTLDQALAIDGPVLIEAVVDTDTPPLPAKIKAEQALHLAEALARGTREAGDILKDIVGSKIRELVWQPRCLAATTRERRSGLFHQIGQPYLALGFDLPHQALMRALIGTPSEKFRAVAEASTRKMIVLNFDNKRRP